MIGERRAQEDGATGASLWPFITALVVLVLVVLGVWALQLPNRDANRERAAVVRAALAQNDALQRLDYAAFRANTCAQQAGVEAGVLADQQNSAARRGGRYVGNVTAVEVDGDRATADVVYYFDKAKDDRTTVVTTFVRENGSWRVCTAGP
jgi:hypothetical protein